MKETPKTSKKRVLKTERKFSVFFEQFEKKFFSFDSSSDNQTDENFKRDLSSNDNNNNNDAV